MEEEDEEKILDTTCFTTTNKETHLIISSHFAQVMHLARDYMKRSLT